MFSSDSEETGDELNDVNSSLNSEDEQSEIENEEVIDYTMENQGDSLRPLQTPISS